MAARAAAGGLAHGGLTAGPPPLLPLCRSQHLCRDLLPSTMTHQWLRGLQVMVLGLALPPLISHDRSLASQPALPLPPPLQKRDKQRPIPMPCALQVRVAWGRLCFFLLLHIPDTPSAAPCRPLCSMPRTAAPRAPSAAAPSPRAPCAWAPAPPAGNGGATTGITCEDAGAARVLPCALPPAASRDCVGVAGMLQGLRGRGCASQHRPWRGPPVEGRAPEG